MHVSEKREHMNKQYRAGENMEDKRINQPAEEKRTFETSIEELEGIVQKLETGNIPLEDMVALYERGAHLGKQCMAMLDEYQGRLETLDREATREDGV